MHKACVALFLAALLSACGNSGTAEPTGSAAPQSLSPLPATVEGLLVADVAEGDVDDGGYSEYNFGTLTVGDEEILVEVSGSLLQSAQIPEEGARVRAVLGSKHEQFGAASYKITSLTRL